MKSGIFTPRHSSYFEGLALVGLVYFLFALFSSAPANAAPVSCGAQMTVALEQELTDAIVCYNNGTTDATIELAANINSVASFTAINPITDRQLDINGNGYVIQTSVVDDVFSIASGRLNLSDIVVDGASGPALRVSGGSTINVVDSRFNNNDYGIVSTSSTTNITLLNSIISGAKISAISLQAGDVTVMDSTIDGSDRSAIISHGGQLELFNTTVSNSYYSAVYTDGGTVNIESSTLSGNRLNGVDIRGGTLLVSNSTVSGNGIGINGGAGNASIANSTISYNNDNGIEAAGAQIRVFSSLIAFNAQGGPYANCLQFSGSLLIVGQAGSSYSSDATCNSFSSGAALSGDVLQSDDLLPLADNGCVNQQQSLSSGQPVSRCIFTHALNANSSAAGSGSCNGASLNPAAPAVSQDQRGYQRANSCDSGAVNADQIVKIPGKPQLISPVNRTDVAANTTVNVTFSDAGGSVTSYQVQRFDRIAGGWTYSTVHSASAICSAATCSAQVPGTEMQNNALWRVRALNSAGWGPWSDNGQFDVTDANGTTPAIPVVQSPMETIQGQALEKGILTVDFSDCRMRSPFDGSILCVWEVRMCEFCEIQPIDL